MPSFLTLLFQLYNVFENLLCFEGESAEVVGTDIDEVIDAKARELGFVFENGFGTLVIMIPRAIAP